MVPSNGAKVLRLLSRRCLSSSLIQDLANQVRSPLLCFSVSLSIGFELVNLHLNCRNWEEYVLGVIGDWIRVLAIMLTWLEITLQNLVTGFIRRC